MAHTKGFLRSVAVACGFAFVVPFLVISDSRARESYCQGRFQDCMQACAVAEQISCEHIEQQLQDWANMVPDVARVRDVGRDVGQSLANKHDTCYESCKKAYRNCDDNAAPNHTKCKCKRKI